MAEMTNFADESAVGTLWCELWSDSAVRWRRAGLTVNRKRNANDAGAVLEMSRACGGRRSGIRARGVQNSVTVLTVEFDVCARDMAASSKP